MSKFVAVQELPELAPVQEQAENVIRARHVSFEDYLRLFDESVHGKIRASALQPGITHVVCFEVLDLWSSNVGHRVSLVVGTKPEGAEIPSWTLDRVLGTPNFRLGDVPSRFQYPVAYADVQNLRKEAGVTPPELDVSKYES